MLIEPLAIDGAWKITPKKFGDPRGLFMEAFRADVLSEVIGHPFDLQQQNLSVSAAGVLRGVHFADVPPGQAKYVSCPRGAIFDVVVDIRVGSPTFGAWDRVLLDDVDRCAVYVGEGLGHAFVSLEDDSVVTYLCSIRRSASSSRPPPATAHRCSSRCRTKTPTPRVCLRPARWDCCPATMTSLPSSADSRKADPRTPQRSSVVVEHNSSMMSGS
jgi:dTDP-4-dehydrorhamnose 3,5-epimerase